MDSLEKVIVGVIIALVFLVVAAFAMDAPAQLVTKVPTVDKATDGNYCAARQGSYVKCVECADAIFAGTGDEALWRRQRVACVVYFYGGQWCTKDRPIDSHNPVTHRPWNFTRDVLRVPVTNQPKRAEV